MGAKAILFKKSVSMVPRENVVKQFINCCENLDLERLEKLVYDESYFYDHNQDEFMTELKTAFSRLKSEGISKVTADTEFIDLCFFKQETH